MPNPTVEIKLEDILVSIQKDLKENLLFPYNLARIELCFECKKRELCFSIIYLLK